MSSLIRIGEDGFRIETALCFEDERLHFYSPISQVWFFIRRVATLSITEMMGKMFDNL